MIATITNLPRFESFVFGADCFLKNFPQITTEGVPVKKIGEFYYVVNEEGKPLDRTCFFSQEEIDECMALKEE